MKKIIIISIPILILGIVSIILYNNRTVTTITMDINPSIEINLNKKDKVKSIKALNDDGNNIITSNIKGKTLDDALDIIVSNVTEKGYIEGNQVTILLYSTGKINNNDIKAKVGNSFGEQYIATDIIVVDKISKEDKELAKKYNISPAKAAYINSIKKDNDKIDVSNLVDESIKGLNETKHTGKYCDKGYNLEGDWCYKEVDRKPATSGKVCPSEYLEYDNNCYEEVPIDHTDKLICRDDYELKGDKCIRKTKINAEAVSFTCPYGKEMTNYEAGLTEADAENANDIVCVDVSNATHPVSPCETHDGTEYTIAGGKCYWHRAPVIETGCPGKVQVNGECWDDASNIYICEGYRDGKRYSSRDEYCVNSIKMVPPTVTEYKCPKDYELEGAYCYKDEVEDAFYEQICPSGYTNVNNDRCINKNKTANKENGLVCNYDSSRLKGNTCIIYDIIESKNS